MTTGERKDLLATTTATAAATNTLLRCRRLRRTELEVGGWRELSPLTLRRPAISVVVKS